MFVFCGKFWFAKFGAIFAWFVFVFDFFLGSKDQKKKSSIFNCYGKVRGLILMSIAKMLSVFFLVVLKINKIKTKFFVKMKWNQDPVVIMRNLKLVLRLLNQINAFGGTTVDYISRDVWILNFSLFDGKKRNNDDCENYKFWNLYNKNGLFCIETIERIRREKFNLVLTKCH